MLPILKWAGGKRQLLPHLLDVFKPEAILGHTYFEPFVGGGALWLELSPKNAVINDYNPDVINIYRQIKENPTSLLELLEKCPHR